MNLLAAQAAVRPKLVWAPKIVEAIAAGSQPPVLTAEALAERPDLPLLWTAQEPAVGVWESAQVQ